MSAINSILAQLSDGQAHSLRELEALPGMEATVLAASLDTLAAWSVEIERVGDRVRWRSPRPLLSEAAIRSHFGAGCPEVDLRLSVDSTNQRLRERFAHGRVCLAEHQSAGRGRRGRVWASPAFANLYLSVGWRFSGGLEGLSGLSLAVGLAAAEALQSFCEPPIGVKWPNDLYVEGRKLGGVLVETAARGDDLNVVAGLGVNVLMEQASPEVDQPWTTLARHGGERDRNRIAAALLRALTSLFRAAPAGIATLLETAWPTRDLSLGRAVTVFTEEGRSEGIGSGIDEQGRLLVATAGGTRRFQVGDVSLRLA